MEKHNKLRGDDADMGVPASPSTASTLYTSPSLEPTWKDAEKGEKDLDVIHLDGDSDDGGSVLLKKEPRSHRLRDIGTLVGGFLAIAATGGMGNAVGLLQRHWEDHQLKDYSPRDVGWIAGTSICLSLVLPVLAGPIFDRYGHRWLLIAGTFSFSLGTLLVSFFDETVPEHLCFSMLILSWGVLCGMGNGLVNTATSGVVCRLFDKRRGLAAGIVSCGNSVGGVIWPMLLRDTLHRWGWKWAIKALAGLVLILLLLGNLLVRDSPYRVIEEKPKKMKVNRGTALKLCVQEGAACFKSGTFVWMTISLALAQFVIMGVVGTLPSWGDEQGYDTDLLFNFVAVMNAASAIGRVSVGAVSDSFGRFNSVIMTQIFSTAIVFGLFFNVHHTTWMFYVFCAAWGFMYGAILSMMNVLIREQCQPEEFGRHMSASYSIISIAGLLCIPLSSQMLLSFGPQMHVIFFGSLCSLSTVFMLITRWGLMNYEWKWLAIV